MKRAPTGLNTPMAGITAGITAVAMGLTALVLAHPPAAAGQSCPDVEVVFARGTTEPAGVGGIGQAFVDAVRAKAGARSVGVYAVDYPASRDFDTSTPAGADDTVRHVQAMAVDCPHTRIVLGGYSQGAAVVDLATNELPGPVADHVAAAAIFGGPSSSFADTLSAGPLPRIDPLYTAKTIDLCVPGDPICSEGGWNWAAHGAYVQTGMVEQAASFAAARL